VALTHCVVAGAREIPCMTFQQGFMFTLRIEHNTVRLLPTTPTLVHDSDTLGLGARIPAALALVGADAFSLDRMAEVVTNGLRVCLDGSVRAVHLHPLPAGLVCEELPFSFFPVVHWKHAVAVRCSDEVLRLKASPPVESGLGGVEPYVRVVHADAWFRYLETDQLLDGAASAEYLAANKDIPGIRDKRVTCRMTRLTSRDKPDILTFFLVQAPGADTDAAAAAGEAGEGGPRCYLYFNSRSHLKWHLQESKGMTFDARHNTRWHNATRHLLVAGRNVFSPFDEDHDSGAFLFMHRIESHDNGRTLALNMADHDDRFVQAKLQAVAESKARVAAVRKWLRDADAGHHAPCSAVLEEQRALLVTREQEHAVQALRSAGVKMTRTVRCHLALCRSADFCLEWTLGPMHNWHQEGPTGLGIITKHPASSEYLLRGQYYVECLLPGVAQPLHALMDFVTAARCVVREGRSVFLRLSLARYFELCAYVGKSMRRGFVMRAPTDLHDALCAAADDEDALQLEAFYVLGDSAVAHTEQHVVRLAVMVHSLNLMDGSHYYNEQEKHKVIVNVRLVDSVNQPIVSLVRDDELELCHNLVYQSRQVAAHSQEQPALADACEIWA